MGSEMCIRDRVTTEPVGSGAVAALASAPATVWTSTEPVGSGAIAALTPAPHEDWSLTESVSSYSVESSVPASAEDWNAVDPVGSEAVAALASAQTAPVGVRQSRSLSIEGVVRVEHAHGSGGGCNLSTNDNAGHGREIFCMPEGHGTSRYPAEVTVGTHSPCETGPGQATGTVLRVPVPQRPLAHHWRSAVDLERGLSSPCLLYTSPSPRDGLLSRMPSSA